MLDWLFPKKRNHKTEVERIVSKLLNPPRRELDEEMLLMLNAISDGAEYWTITAHHIEHVSGMTIWIANDDYGLRMEKPFKYEPNGVDKRLLWPLVRRLTTKIFELDTRQSAISRTIIGDLACFCDIGFDAKECKATAWGKGEVRLTFEKDKILLNRRRDSDHPWEEAKIESFTVADPQYRQKIKSRIEQILNDPA